MYQYRSIIYYNIIYNLSSRKPHLDPWVCEITDAFHTSPPFTGLGRDLHTQVMAARSPQVRWQICRDLIHIKDLQVHVIEGQTFFTMICLIRLHHPIFFGTGATGHVRSSSSTRGASPLAMPSCVHHVVVSRLVICTWVTLSHLGRSVLRLQHCSLISDIKLQNQTK